MMEATEVNREEEIRQIAYRFWQEEGYRHGYDLQHWLKAEAIWQETHQQKKPKPSKALKERKSREPRFTKKRTEISVHTD
jgi:hypothetical protein